MIGSRINRLISALFAPAWRLLFIGTTVFFQYGNVKNECGV